MCITTVSNKKHTTCDEFNIKQPMQTIELNLNRKIHNNPHLMEGLDRSVNNPLVRKFSDIPFT